METSTKTMHAPMPGDVVESEWGGSDKPVKMRLVEHVQHPAGNCWAVHIYDHYRGRYSKTIQHVEESSIQDAIAKAQGR